MKHLRRLWSNSDGVAFIEFALVLPFLLLLFYGGVEITRQIIAQQKVAKSAYVMADIISRYTQDEMTSANINEAFEQYATILEPYDNAGKQAAILTLIEKTAEDHVLTVQWQRAGGGTYSDGATVSAANQRNVNNITGQDSAIQGKPANFTGDYATQLAGTMDGEQILLAEVFYRYEPMAAGMMEFLELPMQSQTYVQRLFIHPRNDVGGPPDTWDPDPDPDPTGECTLATAQCTKDPKPPFGENWGETWVLCEKEIISESPCLASCIWANPKHHLQCD